MSFKIRKSLIVRFGLTIVLLGGVLGALPVGASTELFDHAFEENAAPVFAPYIAYLTDNAYATGMGDFNSDGFQDVAMTAATELLIFLQSSGSLGIPVSYAAGSRPEALAVGDLNNDGRTDIAVVNYSSNTISVFLQQADGSLAPRVIYPTNSGPDAVAIGDVNGDGLADVAVSHWTAPTIGVFTQTVEGGLNPMVTYASPQAGWDDLALADVNNDGRNDVIKMNGQGLNPNLYVYLQNADGTLAPALSYSVTDCGSFCQSHAVDTGDVTGDGRTDIVVSYGGNRPSSKIAVFAQAADGSLQSPVAYEAYDIPQPVEVSDVTSDGRADVLVLHGGWSALSVFTQQNDGTLGAYSRYTVPYTSHYKPQALSAGDLNQDGLTDVAIADSSTGLVLLYQESTSTPTPTFTPPPTFTPTATPVYSYSPLYLSLTDNQTIWGITSADEDILRFDGTNWSLLFDGSDVGVGAADLFAFSVMDEDTLLMSFNTSVFVNGIFARPQDILRFDATSLGNTTAGTFSMYFDGSDVGLNASMGNIDALSLLFDGRLLISTSGTPTVPGLIGGRDEDVLLFTPTSLGNVTTGVWSMYFDGSDVGLADTSDEDVDALDVVGENIFLSTTGAFSVSGLTGADEDVFVCVASSFGDTTVCIYPPVLFFDGSSWGLTTNDVDAFHFLDPGTSLTPTPAPIFTPTATEPTATFTPYYTPTFTVTATEPTATTTPLPGCNSIRDSVGALVVAENTMYLDILNGNSYPVTIEGVRVGWNYENGHNGRNHTLRLGSAQLNGAAFWVGDEYLPVFQIPLSPDALTLPANGTSRITFTFDQTYDRLADESLFVTFSTPGCESYPIDVTVAVEE